MKASEELKKAIEAVKKAGSENWITFPQELDPELSFTSVLGKKCFMQRAWEDNLLGIKTNLSMGWTENRELVEFAARKFGFQGMFDLNDSADDFDHMLMRAWMVVHQLTSEGN
jgi:hypothetical protein